MENLVKRAKFVFFCPPTHVEQVKEKMFETGAGQIGNYSNCCWQVQGQGQFMPIAGANPFVGTKNELEIVDDVRVEILCRNEQIPALLAVLREYHPYEEPAFEACEVFAP